MNHTKYVRLSDGSIGSVLLLKPGCPPLGALRVPAPARRRQDWRRSRARRWITWTRSGRWNRQGRRYYGCRRLGRRRGVRRRSRLRRRRAVIRLAPRTAPTEADQAEAPDHGLVSLDPRLSPQAGRGPHRRLARGMVPDDAYVDSEDVDARLNAARCQQVDLCIDELPWQQRAAIGVHAGNKAAGAAVPQSAPVAASAACRLPGRARAPPCCRRCAGARCWSLARCDTPIAKALVRVGRPLHNDFRRGKLRPAKTEPAELHRLVRRGFLLPADRGIPTASKRLPGACPGASSQDHSVRGARDLRDASASPCARPGGPSFMDARQGPQFRFARHFRRVF